MRKYYPAIVNALVILTLLSYAAQSQVAGRQDKSETIKIRSTEVFVDTVVFDRRNRLVSDLAQQDFEVYEDGVRQEVTSFRVIRAAGKSTAQPATANGSKAPNAGEVKIASIGDLPANLTIVLLDYSTTRLEHQRLVQAASIKYVEQRLQPNDLMAVFILGNGLKLLVEFTNDKAKLIAALKKTDLTGSAMAYDRSTLNANIDAGQSPQMQIQDSSPGAVPSGPNAAAQAAGLTARLSSLGSAIISQHVASLDIAMRSGMDRRQSLGVLSAIRAIAMGVRGIAGRKTLMLFSEGFVVGPSVEDELHSVLGLANRSQVAIYCIESQGLETRELKGDLVPRDDLTNAISNPSANKNPRGGETGFDRARQVGEDQPDSALRYVANSTGGLLIRNTNDLSIGLERIDDEMRTYYLLSYRPKDDKMDGRFRQIRVGVNKPDLMVRARSGYYAMPAGSELLTPGEFQLIEQIRETDPKAKIPIFVRIASFQETSRKFRVPVILEIPSQAIRFDTKQGKHSARLAIVGLVRDRAGNLVKRFGGPVQVDLNEAEYNVLKPGTVSFVNHIQLLEGTDYSFEVLVKDLLSGTVSDDRQTMSLSPADPTLSLSTVLLARDVEKPSNTADQFLIVSGAKILPSARCQFRNGDNLIFYFDIYNSSLEGEKRKSDISIGLSLMREGQLLNARLPSYHVSEDPAPGTGRITFSRYLHLAGLPPGNYTLVIDVKDGLGNKAARGQASFSLLN
jgi:VWFA-related protein